MGRIERVLVCGDRNWTAKHIIMQVLQQTKPKVIIQGGARGADLLGRDCALYLGIKSEQYTAMWDLYGRAAGPIRNKQMIVEGKPEIVLVFHDDIKQSKGTKCMIKFAIQAGVPVNLYDSSGRVQYNVSII